MDSTAPAGLGWDTGWASAFAPHAARKTDWLAREAERRKWRAISASVSDHMRRKYGEA